MNKTLLFVIVLLVINGINNTSAQSHSTLPISTQEHPHHKNDIAGFAGATYICESGFFLPTFGIEYVRSVNSFMGIGVIGEIEVGSHIISKNENSHESIEVNRESAFLLCPAIYFKTGNFVTSVGYGIEFEKSENLALLKVSLMYSLYLQDERWIVLPNISWDHTIHFNGLVYGVSFARVF